MKKSNILIAIALVATLLLGACGTSMETPVATEPPVVEEPTEVLTTEEPSDTPELTIIISNTPTSPAEGTNQITDEITITGTVMDVALSARVIQLEQPVDGIKSIALTDKTKIISVDGEEIGLQSIIHGAQIQATGKIGSPESLVAIQIILLGQ